MNPAMELHDLALHVVIGWRLRPERDDYFVLKPKHSAFFETTLDTLLAYLGTQTLILTGIAGNICILFSANDAYMRDYNLLVPADCCVSNTPEENAHALEQIRRVLKADLTASADIDVRALARARRRPTSRTAASAARRASPRARRGSGSRAR